MDNDRKYFLPYQYDWITDPRPLKIAEKSRQIGITFADAYHSVRIASNKGARYDVFVSSRDKFQAKLYIEDCKNWGQVLEIVLVDLGELGSTCVRNCVDTLKNSFTILYVQLNH